MKALLLAAGFGTRLRPFTFVHAKATLPLLNVPFIRYPLQYLHTQQISDVVINLHSHPESVQKAAGNDFAGMRIAYSHEPEILGTAGAIRKAADLLNASEPFVVLNGDMLMDIPLAKAAAQHRDTRALVTLVVMRGYSHYKGLHFDRANENEALLLQSVEHGPGETLHYTGLQIVSPEVIEGIPADRRTEIFTDVYPALIEQQKIFGFIYEGFWKEIGTLKDFLRTSLDLMADPPPPQLRPEGFSHSIVSPRAAVKSADVTNCVVMDHATIEEGAVLDRCVIGWETTASGHHRNAALLRGFLPWHII